jgi:HD-GYP domain-containing protein (c-di-GMP phosphodiesterase class II)
MVLYHHERYDGKGYPKGLSGEEIPLISHIMAVADSRGCPISEIT